MKRSRSTHRDVDRALRSPVCKRKSESFHHKPSSMPVTTTDPQRKKSASGLLRVLLRHKRTPERYPRKNHTSKNCLAKIQRLYEKAVRPEHVIECVDNYLFPPLFVISNSGLDPRALSIRTGACMATNRAEIFCKSSTLGFNTVLQFFSSSHQQGPLRSASRASQSPRRSSFPNCRSAWITTRDCLAQRWSPSRARPSSL